MLFSNLRQAIARSGSAVLVMPTGSGKTVVAGEIARLAAGKGSRTLFLVHRRELVKQAVDTLLEQCPGISIGVECPGWPSMPWAPLQVSMVQSAARRERMGKPDLVVIDEAIMRGLRRGKRYWEGGPMQSGSDSLQPRSGLTEKDWPIISAKWSLGLQFRGLSPTEASHLAARFVFLATYVWRGCEPDEMAIIARMMSDRQLPER